MSLHYLLISSHTAILIQTIAPVVSGLDLFKVIVLALLQGVAELFPISSLGHTVILPGILHWNINQRTPAYLAFVVMMHFGTAIALFSFYWRDWFHLLNVLWTSLKRGKPTDDPEERFIWLIVVGTIPAALLATLFQDALKSNFGSPQSAAIFLVINGFIMIIGERLRRRAVQRDSTASEVQEVAAIGIKGAVIIGLCQSLALFPGISRSGATMVGGLALGLSHHASMRYAFMLASPIILAASLKTAPDLLTPDGQSILGYAILGCVLSGLSAYASVKFLDRYFKSNRLTPFAIYCIGAGVVSLFLLSTHIGA